MLHDEIVPSILAKDDDEFHTKLTQIENLVTRAQIDIADGEFVPLATVGAPTIAGYATELLLDVHLMVADPLAHVLEYSRLGVDQVIFPFESIVDLPKLKETLAEIKTLGHGVGLSFELPTPISSLEEVIDDLDLVQLMAVTSGGGEQEFDERVLSRLASVRERYPEIPLAVKGGLSVENIGQAREAGANVFVIGSSLFEAESVHEYLERLREKIRL